MKNLLVCTLLAIMMGFAPSLSTSSSHLNKYVKMDTSKPVTWVPKQMTISLRDSELTVNSQLYWMHELITAGIGTSWNNRDDLTAKQASARMQWAALLIQKIDSQIVAWHPELIPKPAPEKK